MDIDDEVQDETLIENEYYKSLTEVGHRQKYRRTAPIIEYLKNAALKNKVTLNELLSTILTQINYKDDKNLYDVGKKILDGESESRTLSFDKTTCLQQSLKLGRSSYHILKYSLPQGKVLLPAWKDLRLNQKKITPTVFHQIDPLIGVSYDYFEALKLTIQRALHLVQNLPPSGSSLIVRLKDGVDGSGSHPIYHQRNNVNSNNMILYMFCLLTIVDVNTDIAIFTENQPNSPHAMRPLFIVIGKENLTNLDNVKTAFRQRSLNTEFLLHFGNYVYDIKIIAEMTMIDGKMRTLLSGLGGAYCLLCFITQKEACGRDGNHSSYFNITRTSGKTMAVWNELADSDNIIKRRKGDYSIRGGLTQEPLIQDVLNMVSPLHAIMRVLGFVLLLIYHLMSETFQWTESPTKLGGSNQRYTTAKEEARRKVYQQTGIKMDIPDATGKGGSTNTGNVCEQLLSDYRHILVSLVPECYQSDLNDVLNRLWVILFIYTSDSKDEVNVDMFREFCTETYNLILNNFNNLETKWINITPTLHMLLAHSWELIEMNNSCGLGECSETGLENNNKFLRFFRLCLSRKNSQETNLQDCIDRLWLKSDIVVRNSGPKKQCSRCHQINNHFTVSCPFRSHKSVESDQNVQTCLTFHDFYISQLYRKY